MREPFHSGLRQVTKQAIEEEKPMKKLAFILAGFMLVFYITGCKDTTAGTETEPSNWQELVSRTEALKFLGAGENIQVNGYQLGVIKDYLKMVEEIEQPGEDDLPRIQAQLTFNLPGRISQQASYYFCDIRTSEPAYVNAFESWYRVSGEVTSQFLSLSWYSHHSDKIDETDKSFLKDYGWTLYFHINSFKTRLPENFIHHPGEFPSTLYWSYNNRLNQDIGMDLTPYLGEEVNIKLYKIADHLPDFMHPRKGAGRAVLVRHGDDIIGTWLDAGRHDGFACSLKGRSREEITGKTWEKWVGEVIDPENPLEKELAALSPEEIIAEYYRGVDLGDHFRAYACCSRKFLRSILFSNMDNRYLYNDGFHEIMGLSNYTAAKLLDIRPVNIRDYSSNTDVEKRQYQVTVDLKMKKEMTHVSGLQTRFINMVKETPQTGWRIDGIGTGP